MGKSIETVFIELYTSVFSKLPSSGSIYQDLNIELSKMGTEELEKQRACTKMKLRECEFYSENQALTFGLPIVSFVFGLFSTIVSLKTEQSLFALVIWLMLTAIAIVFVIGISQHFVNNRKKQAMYHKDKLEIIDTLLKKGDQS